MSQTINFGFIAQCSGDAHHWRARRCRCPGLLWGYLIPCPGYSGVFLPQQGEGQAVQLPWPRCGGSDNLGEALEVFSI